MSVFNNNDKILIVGGTGFLGRHLVRRCLDSSSEVSCLCLKGDFGQDQKFKSAKIIHADLTDKDSLKNALLGRSFDYIFNLGGYIDHLFYSNGGRQMIDAHFTSLMNLIDCLDLTKLKRFVQIGSSDEYGNASAPQNESSREMSIAPYSFAKTAASHFIQMLNHTEGFPGVVIRLFLVYGPGQDDKRFLPQIIKSFLKNEAVETTEGLQKRDFCYVEDAVKGMTDCALSDNSNGKIINIASGIPVTIREMIEKVKTIIGQGNPVFGARSYRQGESMELYADVKLAKDLIGWQVSTSLEDGLRRTVDFYR